MWGPLFQEIVRAPSFDASDSRAGILVAGNSIAGGEGETSSTVGATESGGGGRSRAGSPGNTPSGTRTVSGGTGLGGGGASGAGSPGSESQVLVQVFVFCFVVMGFWMLLCRGIPGNQYAQHVGMFASLTCTTCI